jgi:hypothetical protein
MLQLVEDLLEITPTISSVRDNHSESIFPVLNTQPIFLLNSIYPIIGARNVK